MNYTGATIKSNTKLRFTLVGIVNTIIDFGIYGIMVFLGTPHALANYPGATIALVFSFFANKQYTFNDNQEKNARQIGLFLLITLLGAWVVQPLVISSVAEFIKIIDVDIIDIYAAAYEKICAAAVSMVWNYYLYKRYVFRNNRQITKSE